MSIEFGLVLLLITITSANYAKTLWEHRCDPGSEVFICSVPNFLYKPNENHSTLIAPETVHKVRLGYPTDKKIVSRETITTYDEVLHQALHRPRAIQITFASIKKLDIPLELEYADFQDNSIQIVFAPEVNGSAYALRYLDLRNNEMDDIESFKTLVNLETLLLGGNKISILDGTTVMNFHRLSGLDLGSNMLDTIPFVSLPGSLEWLVLRRNSFYGQLDIDNANLSSLKVLDLQHNLINELNPETLLTVAPSLRAILLEGNWFDVDAAKNIATVLTQKQVEHDKFLPSESVIEYEYDYHRTHEMLKVQDYVISIVLSVVNVCVIGWGVFRVYRAKHTSSTEEPPGCGCDWAEKYVSSLV
ncbi:uncharacterized protein LOC126566070 [Anopheles maculipalpis]|uniref:uncharacterized protein LOC126566070 n=1 Tax=Anopheles maculipalpis TaxID=1496333 RepID=UPI002158F49F|nr:uncharacterized protein LOC126566070 [Anopheles maculipalpis]